MDTQIKSGSESAISLGSTAWNIADGFTKLKILKILIELDMCESVAMFGRQNMEDVELVENIPLKRVEALNRILFLLNQLLGNCRFSIKEKKDKIVVDNLYCRIDNVEKYIDSSSSTIVNQVTNEEYLEINKNHFNLCFNILRNIKDELNFPLDRASLIFRHSDDIELDDIMKDIVEGG